jgi:hypothetical protein
VLLTIAFTQMSKAKGLVFKISEYGIITGMMRPISEQVESILSDGEDDDDDTASSTNKSRSDYRLQFHVHHQFLSTDLGDNRLPTEYWG